MTAINLDIIVDLTFHISTTHLSQNPHLPCAVSVFVGEGVMQENDLVLNLDITLLDVSSPLHHNLNHFRVWTCYQLGQLYQSHRPQIPGERL